MTARSRLQPFWLANMPSNGEDPFSFALMDSEKHALRISLARLDLPNPYTTTADFISVLDRFAESPKAIAEFARLYTSCFYFRHSDRLLVSNLPLDEVLPLLDPAAPTESKIRSKRTFIAEAVQFLVMRWAGLRPFGYMSSREGLLYVDVSPQIGKEDTQSSMGAGNLTFHRDAMRRRVPPPALCLLGLRDGDPAVTFTLTCLISQALSAVDPDQGLLLSRNHFETPSRDTEDAQHAVLDGQRGFNFFGDLTRSASSEAQYVISKINRNCEHYAKWHRITPGTLLLFRNDRVLHAKRVIDPSAPVSYDRWLLKAYGDDELHPALRDTNVPWAVNG